MARERAMIDEVEAYLALRRAVGFALRHTDRILRNFARFAARRRERHVRITTAIDFARRSCSPERREHVLGKIRLLARHLRAADHRHEVPPAHVFSGNAYPRPTPFIFTLSQVDALVQAAFRLAPIGDPLRPQTYGTLFALLAATGLRISEALALRIDDVTADGLRIRNTKFHKNRLVPLHPTAAAGLERYLMQRRRLAGDTIFATSSGRPISYERVKTVYKKLLPTIGIQRRDGHPRPRLHCLRHTFAVRVLQRCPSDRTRIAQHQVALMTYLGHTHVASTYWYLETTPELLEQIAHVSERQVGGYS